MTGLTKLEQLNDVCQICSVIYSGDDYVEELCIDCYVDIYMYHTTLLGRPPILNLGYYTLNDEVIKQFKDDQMNIEDRELNKVLKYAAENNLKVKLKRGNDE